LAEKKLKYVTQSDKSHKHRLPPKGPWSAKKLAKQRKEERRLKKAKKREFLKKRKADDMKSSNSIDNNNDTDIEWEELQKEERLAKKLKKRKIEGEEFEKEIGLVSN